MTCTGLDAETADVCMKIEQIAKKYDKPVMDIMNRIMQMHITWDEQ